MGKKNFPALTGIRFIAASFVFLCHYSILIISQQEYPLLFFFLKQLNIGVTIFFVLSGFLIAYRYYEYSFTFKKLFPYFIKRFAKIFPLYILILVIQFFLLARQNKLDDFFWLGFLNITLLKGLSEKYVFTGIAQSWSLTVEEMFYLLAPFSFYLIKVKKFFLYQIPIVSGIGVLLVLFFSYVPLEGFFASLPFMFSTTFFGRCFEFFTGIYIALLVINRNTPSKNFKHYTLYGGLLFCALLFATTFYAYYNKVDFMNKTVLGIILLNFFLPVTIAIFYFGLITEKSLVRKFLSAGWVVLLGKSSYAFYLIHFGMIAEVILFHISSSIWVLFIILQLLSILAYKCFEKPVYFFVLRKFGLEPR